MKRAASSIQATDRAYTQQPASCRFCRSRKLKCDRSRPSCFNCKSRNHECTYEADQERRSLQDAASTVSSARVDFYADANNDLARRVERLERAVLGKNAELGLKVPDEDGQRSEPRELPTYKEAVILLRYFIETVDATYRMLHHPTAWYLLRMLYDDLETNRPPSPTQLAFFLYIFASSAYVSKIKFHFESRTLQTYSPIVLAELWACRAVALVTTPPVPPSVEALQTVVGLAHLCIQIDGLSGSFGTIGMFGMQMAKAMHIHHLDSRSNREDRRRDGADMVIVEVKRRIWWHMVASDWLLSFLGGHNDGTYMFHPRQMETWLPSNVEDTDIPAGITYVTEQSYSSPTTSPTSMSYYLQRVRAATLVREVVDSLPPSYFDSTGSDTSDEVYDIVMNLDHTYQKHIDSLPPFFQLTIQNTQGYQKLLSEKPYLEWQRYLINLILHTQVVRLHRPFLIRGLREAKYVHSRQQCIRSSEIVVEIRNRAVSNENTGSFIYVLQHFLAATIVLAVDACLDPNSKEAPRRKQQVLRACRALEEDLRSGANSMDNVAVGNQQLMFFSFQKAVRGLRDTLRKQVHDNNLDGSTSAVPRVLAIPTESQKLPSHAAPADLVTTRDNSPWLDLPQNELQPALTEAPLQLNNPTTSSEDPAVSGAPSELLMDQLWNDFFTVGPTLDEADWDGFFSDVAVNMSG